MPFLTELLAAYPDAISIEGTAERLAIAQVTSDSRAVGPGALFVAIRGHQTDGSIYALDAVAQGAVAILTEEECRLALPKSIVWVKVKNPREALARMAAALYAPQPGCVAAVTGTDGKTSTVEFFRQLWQMSYQKSASIGTLGVRGGPTGAVYPTLGTTPDPAALHQTLQSLAREGRKHVAIEASSHGLDQHRLDGVHICAAGFTNITRDHLDYHGTLERYFHAKLRLFRELLADDGTAVLNADDPKFRRLQEACATRKLRVITYGERGRDYQIHKITATLDGLAIQARIEGKAQHFMLHMVGSFQAFNALCALGLYVGCGGCVEEGLKHLPHLQGVPGRLERVAGHPSGAAIFVDYAHTPAALSHVLATLRPLAKGKLSVVFGCGGERDKGKRPQMGKAAAEGADLVFVTDDNPRGEDPARIRAEIMAAAPGARDVADRAQAIARAVDGLERGDVLLIAGKGHEATQIVGSRTLPFSDVESARLAMKPVASTA